MVAALTPPTFFRSAPLHSPLHITFYFLTSAIIQNSSLDMISCTSNHFAELVYILSDRVQAIHTYETIFVGLPPAELIACVFAALLNRASKCLGS